MTAKKLDTMLEIMRGMQKQIQTLNENVERLLEAEARNPRTDEDEPTRFKCDLCPSGKKANYQGYKNPQLWIKLIAIVSLWCSSTWNQCIHSYVETCYISTLSGYFCGLRIDDDFVFDFVWLLFYLEKVKQFKWTKLRSVFIKFYSVRNSDLGSLIYPMALLSKFMWRLCDVHMTSHMSIYDWWIFTHYLGFNEIVPSLNKGFDRRYFRRLYRNITNPISKPSINRLLTWTIQMYHSITVIFIHFKTLAAHKKLQHNILGPGMKKNLKKQREGPSHSIYLKTTDNIVVHLDGLVPKPIEGRFWY